MALGGRRANLSPDASPYLKQLETRLTEATATLNAAATQIAYLQKRLADTAGSSLGDGTVITSKLADGAVTTPKVADGAITNAKVSTGISGSKISGAVASATTAAQADGVTSAAYARNAVGSGFVAAWMNSDLQLMRNTSSRRFKENIERLAVDPAKVLALEPVEYDRIGGGHEYGLIAEAVNELLPEVVVWFAEPIVDEEGKPTGEFGEPRVDGIRYDLLSVALLEVVKSLSARIETLENDG